MSNQVNLNMVTEEERIQRIKSRRDKANAKARTQILRLRGGIRKRDRRADTRRKILAGAVQFDAIERGEVPAEETLRNMDAFLDKPADRALFGLPASRQPDAVTKAATAFRSMHWSRGGRTDDTRRKILAGAMLLDKVARGEFPELLFKAMMDLFLRRTTDRALFELPPRPDDGGDQAS